MKKKQSSALCRLIVLVAAGAVFRSAAALPQFQDVTSSVGLDLSTTSMQEQPVTWCDYDQDGWVDFLIYGKLWKNINGQSFSLQVTPGHMSGGGVWGDYNNDGWPDVYMYITRHLFLNDGDGTFTLRDAYLLNNSDNHSNCVAATWGDFDGNGTTDLFMAGYESAFGGTVSDDVIMLTRDGTTIESVWADEQYIARGVTGCDFDRDFDYDLYVSNYRLYPNTLWVNDGSGSFQNKAAEYNVQSIEREWTGSHSIGANWADFNNDGYFDLFSGNFSHRGSSWGLDGIQPESDFFRNRGPDNSYYFEDLGNCGVYWQESYACPACGDFDNDGYVDLFITTIYSTSTSGEQNHCALFRNNGDWTFSEVTSDTGLGTSIQVTMQAAWADYDNDGFLDLMTDGKLYRNGGNTNKWLKVKLIGGGRATRSNIGAQVFVYNGAQTYSRQVEGAVGQANANDPTLHFGLGGNPSLPLTLEIRWTDGTRQMQSIREVNQLLTIEKTTEDAYDTSLLFETFDRAHGILAGSVDSQNGWVVSAGTNATVQSSVFQSGEQALQMSESKAVNSYFEGNEIEAWARFYARISSASGGAVPRIPGLKTGAVLMMDTNRSLMAYSNDVPVDLGVVMDQDRWVRFDLYCNYETGRWTLSMDGTSLSDGLDIHSAGTSHELLLLNRSGFPLYVDQMQISHQELSDWSDSDADGLPDWWELKYSGSVVGLDAGEISRNGDMTYLETYISGVSPFSEEPFQISFLDGFQGVSWPSVPGRLVSVEWTDNLLKGFTLIATNIPSDQAEFMDEEASIGFYRVNIQAE